MRARTQAFPVLCVLDVSLDEHLYKQAALNQCLFICLDRNVVGEPGVCPGCLQSCGPITKPRGPQHVAAVLGGHLRRLAACYPRPEGGRTGGDAAAGLGADYRSLVGHRGLHRAQRAAVL